MQLLESKFINGSHLKILAITTMLIDHIGYYILDDYAAAHQILFSFWGLDFSPFLITRFIGRSAFPIFAFLITEGFLHTHSRLKYGRNLLVFAFLSELPWNLVHYNHLFYERQNVFFTLFLGFLTLCVLEKFKKDVWKRLLSLFSIFAGAYFLKADYGIIGVLFITLLYLLRNNPMLMTIAGMSMLPGKWICGIAFIPIAFYNGQRGFIQGNLAKYAFYLFYPLHLLIIYIIKFYLLST